MMTHLRRLLEQTTQHTLSMLAIIIHIVGNVICILNLSFLCSPAFLKVELVVLWRVSIHVLRPVWECLLKFVYFVISFFFFSILTQGHFFRCFLRKGEGRKTNTDAREKHRLVASRMNVPRLGIKPITFQLWGDTPTNWATSVGAVLSFWW